MVQFEIDQAVAEKLGEEIHNVQRLGFSLIDPQEEFVDPECDCQDPQVLGWDGDVPEVESFHSFAA